MFALCNEFVKKLCFLFFEEVSFVCRTEVGLVWSLSRTVWSDIEVMESKSMSDWVEFC